MAAGGAVRATVKSPIADSGMRPPTRDHEPRLVPPLPNSSPRLEFSDWSCYSECDARCSASHCSLIQPRLAQFTAPGTRILGMMTTAINTMTTPTMNT